jgi:hypothetical protein
MDDFSRRRFLAAGGAALGAAWLAARPEQLEASAAHAAAARQAAAQGQPLPPLEVLTPEQAADIDAIASQVIPTDDLPGAHEARVMNFIDHGLATWAQDQRGFVVQGLDTFNASVTQRYGNGQPMRYAQLTPAQQLEFLSANDRTLFFGQLRFVVLVGMFSNPQNGGNYDKAGYQVLGYDDRYVWQAPFGWYDDKVNGGPN